MNQINTGKFIRDTRKEIGLTQRELAEKLRVSDKTISKWETGNGLPDAANMLPLCAALGISVNELLSAEKLEGEVYKSRAEENMIDLMRQREQAKKNIILSCIVGAITIISGVGFLLIALMLAMPLWIKIVLVCLAIIVIVFGIGVACVLDRDAGVFECPVCGERFVPSMKDYVMGAHTLLKRNLTCPNCGKKSFCRKRLNK